MIKLCAVSFALVFCGCASSYNLEHAQISTDAIKKNPRNAAKYLYRSRSYQCYACLEWRDSYRESELGCIEPEKDEVRKEFLRKALRDASTGLELCAQAGYDEIPFADRQQLYEIQTYRERCRAQAFKVRGSAQLGLGDLAASESDFNQCRLVQERLLQAAGGDKAAAEVRENSGRERSHCWRGLTYVYASQIARAKSGLGSAEITDFSRSFEIAVTQQAENFAIYEKAMAEIKKDREERTATETTRRMAEYERKQLKLEAYKQAHRNDQITCPHCGGSGQGGGTSGYHAGTAGSWETRRNLAGKDESVWVKGKDSSYSTAATVCPVCNGKRWVWVYPDLHKE